MTSSQASESVAKQYANLGGKNNALSWPEIIEWIMSLLAGCKPADAKEFAKKHPLAVEFLLKQKVMRMGVRISGREAGLIAKAGVKAFNAAKLEDVEDLMT